MSGLLVVRPSSLGDVVHALALIADVRAHDRAMPIDWVAEEAFVPLVRLDARIRNVVPMAFRRWREAPFAPQTWREFCGFRRALRREEYSVVLDLQEQVKGAIVTRMARGRRHGFDRKSIREPLATWFDDVHHRIARDQHFIDKSRALAAAAFGYRVEGPPRWQFAPPDRAGIRACARVPRDQPRRQAVARGTLACAARALCERGTHVHPALGKRS
jgi:heptosyltransferase-1